MAPRGGQMGVTSPSTTRQLPVAIAPDKAATFEAGTTLRSLTTSLQHTPTVPVAVISFFDTWVNAATKVYHCAGSKYYGKTKQGEYMTQAAAKAASNHADHGTACAS